MVNKPETLTLEECVEHWGLAQVEQLAETHTSQVYKVQYADRLAVLKLLNPTGIEFEQKSASALRSWSSALVTLFEAKQNALLLEYLPGPDLKSLVVEGSDLRAAEIIAELVLGACIEVPVGLDPTPLVDTFESLFTRVNNTSDELLVRAAETADELLTKPQGEVLLHGDVHHENILQDEKGGWKLIDPKVLVGELAYEVANCYFNPYGLPALVTSEDRIRAITTVFSRRLDVAESRLLQFAIAHGGLSVSWELDRGNDGAERSEVLEALFRVFDELAV